MHNTHTTRRNTWSWSAGALLIAALTSVSATAGPTDAPDDAQTQGRTILQQMLDAHGGLEKFRSYGTVTYHTDGLPYSAQAPLQFNHIADLAARRHRMEGFSDAGSFIAGANDEIGWTTNADALGIPPRWVNHGNSYFALMPFVFADPGASVRFVGDREFDGQVFDAIAVNYSAGVGDTFEDDYVLYIDKQTHMLRLIDFSVTYGPMRGDTPIDELPRRSLEFVQWQQADGLLVPKVLHYAPWQRTATGGQRTDNGVQYTITNARFAASRPSAAIFDAPDGAHIE